MKILVFLHGTIIMHKNAESKMREEIVQQVLNIKSIVVKEFAGIDNLPDDIVCFINFS